MRNMLRKKIEEAHNFKVHPNYILVIVKKAKDSTDGGVILPESATKERTPEVEVIDIGDNMKDKITFNGQPLQIGDACYIRADEYLVNIAEINGVPFGFAAPDAILGVIKK